MRLWDRLIDFLTREGDDDHVSQKWISEHEYTDGTNGNPEGHVTRFHKIIPEPFARGKDHRSWDNRVDLKVK